LTSPARQSGGNKESSCRSGELAMRFNGRVLGVSAGAIALVTGMGVWACAGGDENSPRWALVTKDYAPFGSSALLTPGNDTRVNLYLLLADGRPSDALINSEQANQPNAL